MLTPKKSLGQNFLIDKNISKKILKLVNNYENKNIIEIGPGTGALTENIIPIKIRIGRVNNFITNQFGGSMGWQAGK